MRWRELECVYVLLYFTLGINSEVVGISGKVKGCVGSGSGKVGMDEALDLVIDECHFSV